VRRGLHPLSTCHRGRAASAGPLIPRPDWARPRNHNLKACSTQPPFRQAVASCSADSGACCCWPARQGASGGAPQAQLTGLPCLLRAGPDMLLHLTTPTEDARHYEAHKAVFALRLVAACLVYGKAEALLSGPYAGMSLSRCMPGCTSVQLPVSRLSGCFANSEEEALPALGPVGMSVSLAVCLPACKSRCLSVCLVKG
jgi:hypothetical protein